MTFLLDTCVVAEFAKPQPDRSLMQWLEDKEATDLFLSVVSVGEIKKGIAKLDDGNKKKKKLMLWLYNELLPYFQDRILLIDQAVMESWGEINGLTEKMGKKIPIMDGLLAAIAYTQNMIIVTRNIKDFKHAKVSYESPWKN